MNIRRIRHKLLITLTIALSLGFATIAYFYTVAVEKSIISDYQRTLHRLTDTVVMNIETIMKENHAEIMPDFARRLKTLPGVIDFRIARIDGTEAYIDNQTIDAVNARLGEATFPRRSGSEPASRREISPTLSHSCRSVWCWREARNFSSCPQLRCPQPAPRNHITRLHAAIPVR